MKINLIGKPEIVMENRTSLHNYFGWPTAVRLQNGKIAVAASGFRLGHVCPFGKTVISFSEDEGETYTLPAPVIDTVLDDRDGGIVPFGKSSVIVTSFNNAVAFQREKNPKNGYCQGYLDTVSAEEEKNALGATFRISNDCGLTFGKLHKSPITSPHGPLELVNGTLLWVGRLFNPHDTGKEYPDGIQVHKINPDGSMEYVSTIENIDYDGKPVLACEPHAVLLDDGRILVHIRVQNLDEGIFTTVQTESSDNGKTWTKPTKLLSKSGGAPSHLLKLSSGILLSTYGFRGDPEEKAPFGIRAMFSKDGGKTWDTSYRIYDNEISPDLGYPSTVELKDGSLLTVFYAIPEKGGPAVIMQQKWRLDDEI